MDATSSADLVHTQVHPRRPWRTQGPRPSVRGSMEEEKEEEPAATGTGHPARPGHPAHRPEIRPLLSRELQNRPSQPGHPPPRPGHLAPRLHIWTLPIQRASRPTAPAQTSGLSRAPGHPASSPEIRTPPFQRATRLDPASPDIRPQRPDIQPDARTSAPCLCAAHLGRVPCTPSPLRLYILPLHLCFRVSVVLAHLKGDRAAPLRRRSTWIQDLLMEKTIKTSS